MVVLETLKKKYFKKLLHLFRKKIKLFKMKKNKKIFENLIFKIFIFLYNS